MASNDMEVGIEGYLFERKKTDYPNITIKVAVMMSSIQTQMVNVFVTSEMDKQKLWAKLWCPTENRR